ncbi:MAG: alpha/beta fold hydrolase [Thermoleophilia bacterium]
MRRRGPEGAPAVLCADGGTARPRPGTWSASVEWLVARLAPRHPALALYELRYRVRSWKALDDCIDDARAALDRITAGIPERPVLLVGYSMGGAVCAALAGHPAVRALVGLAPWLPEQIDLSPLAGRRLAVIHGALDAALPGIPGVRASSSLAGVRRARAAGVEATHSVIPGAVHPVALRLPGGALLPAPRAREWLRRLDAEAGRYGADPA